MLVWHCVHKQSKLFFYLEKSIDAALLLSLYLQQTNFWLSISDSCSVEIFILQVFCTMMPTKCGKSRDALHLATVTVGVHLPVVASRDDVLDPFQLCSAIDMSRIVHSPGFSNGSVEESENTDRIQQMNRLVALNNLFAL